MVFSRSFGRHSNDHTPGRRLSPLIPARRSPYTPETSVTPLSMHPGIADQMDGSVSSTPVTIPERVRPIPGAFVNQDNSDHSTAASSPERVNEPDEDATSSSSREGTAILPETFKLELRGRDHRFLSSRSRLQRHHRYGSPPPDRPPAPIERLPPELLIMILSKLSSTNDLFSAMLVSRTWAVMCVPILWHRPACSSWRNLMNVVRSISNPASAFSYAELIRRLNFASLYDSVSHGTLQPFMQCNKIERLTLTNCSGLTDQPVSDLVSRNHMLQALDVTELDSLTDHTLQNIAENCPRLQGLNLTGCINVTDEAVANVAQNCKQLKRIKLNGIRNITDNAVVQISLSCQGLVEIDLFNCFKVTSASVQALLLNLPHLRELRLALCGEITDSAFLQLPDNVVFDNLRILDLTSCENLRDPAVIKIINQAPKLRNIVLAKCKFLTDKTLAAIAKLGKNLHYLHLGHVLNITDAGLLNLIHSCTRIRYIDLACCNRLTDRSVCALSHLPKLRRIGLVKCTNITDASIVAIAQHTSWTPLSTFNRDANANTNDNGNGTANASTNTSTVQQRLHEYPFLGLKQADNCLERIHLSYCVNLTLDSIHFLLNACPKLKHVSLTGVHAFLRDDLTVFCREAPSEFTPAQRDVFCVFSGDGVKRLKNYLNSRWFQSRWESSRQGPINAADDRADVAGGAADDARGGGAGNAGDAVDGGHVGDGDDGEVPSDDPGDNGEGEHTT